MNNPCVSRQLMSHLVEWRNQDVENPVLRVGQIAAVEVGLLTLTVTASIEAVAYASLALVSLAFVPITDQPLKFFASLLESSASTILHLVSAIFLNLREEPLHISVRQNTALVPVAPQRNAQQGNAQQAGMNPLYTQGVQKKIFSFLSNQELSVASQIDQSSRSSIISSKLYAENLLREAIFGPEDWKKLFGVDVDSVPKPANILEILMEPSPLDRTRKVGQDFMLVLIPRTMSFNRLIDLVKDLINGRSGFRYIWDEITNRFGNNAPDRSYWVLMSKTVVPESRGETYFQQQTRVQNLGEAYEIPRFLEAAICILTRYAKFGERLYSDDPLTFTRCQEMIHGFPLIVGGFAPSGLYVNDYRFAHETCGVGVLRKF